MQTTDSDESNRKIWQIQLNSCTHNHRDSTLMWPSVMMLMLMPNWKPCNTIYMQVIGKYLQFVERIGKRSTRDRERTEKKWETRTSDTCHVQRDKEMAAKNVLSWFGWRRRHRRCWCCHLINSFAAQCQSAIGNWLSFTKCKLKCKRWTGSIRCPHWQRVVVSTAKPNNSLEKYLFFQRSLSRLVHLQVRWGANEWLAATRWTCFQLVYASCT